MIGGQYLDVRPPPALDEAGLRRLCRLKTGALIEASVGCALRAGRRRPASRRGRSCALRAPSSACCFQIVDDVLDATGTDEQLGKPAGADARRQAHLRDRARPRAGARAGRGHRAAGRRARGAARAGRSPSPGWPSACMRATADAWSA